MPSKDLLIKSLRHTVGNSEAETLAINHFRWRTLAGVTQKEVARATGLSPSTISRVEHGYHVVTYDTLNALALYWSLYPRDLLRPDTAPVASARVREAVIHNIEQYLRRAQ